MKDATRDQSRPTNTDDAEGLARGLAALLLACAVLVVLFAGTFPFDFSAPEGSALEQLRHNFDPRFHPPDPRLIDRIQNVLFFMPFGFAVAAVIHRRRATIRFGAAALLGAALSAGVEGLQAFVSFRDPSFADVWCNTLGSALGAGAYSIAGRPLLHGVAAVLHSLKPLASPVVLWILAAMYAVLHLCAPLWLRSAGDLSVWDPGMPLVVGNELTGDRGWNGSVREIVLADRAATAEEAQELARGADPTEVLSRSLVAFYALRDAAPYKDQTGTLPELDWAGAPAMLTSGFGAMLSEENWLKTSAPVEPATNRIRTSSQFTFAVTAATFDSRPQEFAPRRIAGISSSPSARNVQFGQDAEDLVVRVRTAVRSMPDLYVHRALADANYHHLLVTLKEAQIIIYVDGMERGRCEITPEAKVIWRLYPRGVFRLRAEKYGFRSYAAIYRMLVFIPLAALLGAALRASALSPWTKRLTAGLALLGMGLVLEGIIAAQTASGFQLRNLAISLGIGGATLGVLAAWRWRRGRAPNL